MRHQSQLPIVVHQKVAELLKSIIWLKRCYWLDNINKQAGPSICFDTEQHVPRRNIELKNPRFLVKNSQEWLLLLCYLQWRHIMLVNTDNQASMHVTLNVAM